MTMVTVILKVAVNMTWQEFIVSKSVKEKPYEITSR